jgi:hypothetical protein
MQYEMWIIDTAIISAKGIRIACGIARRSVGYRE